MLKPIVVEDKEKIRDLTAEVDRLRSVVLKYDVAVADAIQKDEGVPQRILDVFYE